MIRLRGDGTTYIYNQSRPFRGRSTCARPIALPVNVPGHLTHNGTSRTEGSGGGCPLGPCLMYSLR